MADTYKPGDKQVPAPVSTTKTPTTQPGEQTLAPGSVPATALTPSNVMDAQRKPRADTKAVGVPTVDPRFPEGVDRSVYHNRLSNVDPDKVEPGPGPLQGSPNPTDPYKLANPNNPNSPVTGSANPSNPANPPATQSDKPISETRVLYEQTALDAQAKADPALVQERKDTLAKIDASLKKYGAESNIPAGDEYWSLVGRYRTITHV